MIIGKRRQGHWDLQNFSTQMPHLGQIGIWPVGFEKGKL